MSLRTSYAKSIGKKLWLWCKSIHKRLLDACVSFTKNGLRIVDNVVLSRIRIALRELGIINRRVRIIMEGEIKALEMQIQYKKRNVFSWAPKLKEWLNQRSYKIWLGILQLSLEGNSFLIVKVKSDGFTNS
ncbi:MAG: hypothetical protein QXZ25_04950 [Candidatus Bathyarchaeia archaeon]